MPAPIIQTYQIPNKLHYEDVSYLFSKLEDSAALDLEYLSGEQELMSVAKECLK